MKDNAQEIKTKPNNRNSKDNKKNTRRNSRGAQHNNTARTSDRQQDTRATKWMSDSNARNANDIRWYSNSPEQLKSAASLSWTGVAGQQMFGQDESVPGVMVLDWVPSIGGDDFTAVNQAANSMYSFIVHANSRNYKYDPNDLMLMILAGANAFSGFAEGVRVFGVMNRYNGIDRYTPQALVKALGFDFDDLRDNLSQMWFDLNHLANQLQQIWIPNVMPVVERWFWMNSNIYRDSTSAKAQYYVFRQAVFYTLNETYSSNGTALTINTAHIHKPRDRKWSDYMAGMNEMLNALINAQDRGMIFGDILNAYGADKLYAVSSIDVNYATPISYNAEVLSQIENASVCMVSAGAILQDMNKNRIYQEFAPKEYANFAALDDGPKYLPDDGILNFHQLTAPTPEQIMVATRLRCAGLMITAADLSDEAHKKIAFKPVTNGTEIVIGVHVYKMRYTGNVAYVGEGTDITTNFGQDKDTDFYMYEWCTFDWAPWLYRSNANTRSVPAKPSVGYIMARLQPTKCYGDWDNWSEITREELSKLHTTAILSEFGVPITI